MLPRHAAAVAFTIAAVLFSGIALAQERPQRSAETEGKLRQVREKIELTQGRLHEIESALAGIHARKRSLAQGALDGAVGERVEEIDRRIAEAETALVEMREGRRYTENHPEVKSRLEVVEALRTARIAAIDHAHVEHAAARREIADAVNAHQKALAGTREHLAKLRRVEQELGRKAKASHRSGVAARGKDGKGGGVGGGKGGPGGKGRAAADHSVNERLAKLERAVAEMREMLGRRGGNAQFPGFVRSEGARPPAAGRERERREGVERQAREWRAKLHDLEKALVAEREESEELRRMLQKARGERERGDGARADERRQRDADELRRHAEELAERVAVEREENEELREHNAELREELDELRGLVERLRERLHRRRQSD